MSSKVKKNKYFILVLIAILFLVLQQNSLTSSNQEVKAFENNDRVISQGKVDSQYIKDNIDIFVIQLQNSIKILEDFKDRFNDPPEEILKSALYWSIKLIIESQHNKYIEDLGGIKSELEKVSKSLDLIIQSPSNDIDYYRNEVLEITNHFDELHSYMSQELEGVYKLMKLFITGDITDKRILNDLFLDNIPELTTKRTVIRNGKEIEVSSVDHVIVDGQRYELIHDFEEGSHYEKTLSGGIKQKIYVNNHKAFTNIIEFLKHNGTKARIERNKIEASQRAQNPQRRELPSINRGSNNSSNDKQEKGYILEPMKP